MKYTKNNKNQEIKKEELYPATASDRYEWMIACLNFAGVLSYPAVATEDNFEWN